MQGTWPLFLHGAAAGPWYRTLLKELEEEDILHDEEEQVLQKRETRMSPVIEVDSTTLQYTWELRRYLKDPNARNSLHTSVYQNSVHF